MEKLRKIVNQIAYTQKISNLPPTHLPLVPVLRLASSIYGITLFLRRRFYDLGIFRKHRLPVPVISVGNLTWGGNGKTPMVEFMAVLLSDLGISPLILTRGYGGADEAKMLERHLNGTSVKIGVGANRVATAASFLDLHGYANPQRIPSFEKLCSNIIGVAILDDGMQHLSLWRNLEIVMLNGISPWGNHHLIPFGPLRESFTSLGRANVVVIHHADLISEKSLTFIQSTILEVNQCLPIYLSRMAPSHFFEVHKLSCRLPLAVVCNMSVLCLSAVGSPDSFVQKIQKMGPLHIDRLDYSDHHQFQNEDVDMIMTRLQQLQIKFMSKPIVVVTEKDYDRDPEVLKQLVPFEVLVLCSKLQIIPHRGCSEESFKKLLMQCWS